MTNLKLDNKEHSFKDQEKHYREFFGPTFQVIVDGQNLSQKGVAISRVTVSTTVDASADVFYFDVVNAYDPLKREILWLEQYFSLGKYIEIKMGYVDKIETVFYGLITSVEVDLNPDETLVTVRGMDVSFLMMKGVYSNTWNEKKYSDVVRMIGQKYLSDLRIDDTEKKISVITQDNETDFLFLTRLAEINHFNFFVVGKTMYFRKMLKDKQPVIHLFFGENLQRFYVDMNIASQVNEVIVRGWDGLQNEVIVGKSTKVNRLGSNAKTGPDIMKALGKSNVEYIHANVDSVEEAKGKAEATLNKYAMELMTGEGETLGIPQLRAGRYVKIGGVGKKLSQPYYLTAVTHTIDQSGYVTSFRVGGNAI